MDDIRPPQRTTAKNENNSTPINESNLDESLDASNTVPHEDFHLNGSSLPVSTNKPKSPKKARVTIIILVILLLVSIGASAYLYVKQQDMQKQIDTLTAENKQLNEKIYSLEYDNKDFVKKEAISKEQKDLLVEKLNMLKTNCGTNCKDISIPTL